MLGTTLTTSIAPSMADVFSAAGGDTSRAPGTFASIWTLTDQEPETLITLATVTIKDIPDASEVTLPGGWLASINGGGFVSEVTTMDELDTIAIQITSGVYEAIVSGNVGIDGVNCAVSVTSRADTVTSTVTYKGDSDISYKGDTDITYKGT